MLSYKEFKRDEYILDFAKRFLLDPLDQFGNHLLLKIEKDI